jgi:hypothetical protein
MNIGFANIQFKIGDKATKLPSISTPHEAWDRFVNYSRQAECEMLQIFLYDKKGNLKRLIEDSLVLL